MINLDVCFTDPLCYKPYDNNTLATEPLGGTEASVIRVAEGLARTGMKVGVVQHNRTVATMGAGVFYLPESSIPSIRIKHHVMLRGIVHANTFPGAYLYSWQHDLPNTDIAKWIPTLCEKQVTVVAVSDWHKREIRRFLCDGDATKDPRVTYIYNPVPCQLYDSSNGLYHKQKLVWLSSPHKGLAKAIDLFGRLRELTGDKGLELHVFNPGYFPDAATKAAGVIARGSMPCAQAWSEIRDALCVFYPSQFPETFGLVVAEANALGVPVATYSLGALPEVVSSYEQTVGNNDEKALLDLVQSWYGGNRPTIKGQDKFRTTEVIQSWLTLFKSRCT